MAKYSVHVTYTPDDRDCDRSRSDASFESDSPDKAKVAKEAIVAWQAAKGPQHDADRFIELFMEKGWEEDDLYDQNLEDGLEFYAFGNDGEWCFEVTKEGTDAS